MTQQRKRQICTTASRKTESHSELREKVHATEVSNPEADDKTTIKALIKGLTPGPTASHLTRKKPKMVEELFRELEEYILSDDDHRKRVAERNEARQGNRDMIWRAPPQHP
jgi:hypothetical protein